MTLQAITFDLWDTLVVDDSDEVVRATRGLLPKPQARAALFVQELRRHHPQLPADAAAAAWEHSLAWFRHAWKVEHHTPSVAGRVDTGLAALGLSRTPGFDALVDALERMEVELPPLPVPGMVQALDTLAGRYRLAIISDAIVTPGTRLRELLAGLGMRDFFEVFVFSDEAGASKPDRRVFDLASQGLGVPLPAMAHVGDREANDVAGPLAVGMRAVLFTAAVDRGSADTAASAVCASAAELPATLDRL